MSANHPLPVGGSEDSCWLCDRCGTEVCPKVTLCRACAARQAERFALDDHDDERDYQYLLWREGL